MYGDLSGDSAGCLIEYLIVEVMYDMDPNLVTVESPAVRSERKGRIRDLKAEINRRLDHLR